MGWIPPPSAVSQKEFDKRWRAGARTLKEIDPAFWKWKRDREIDGIFAVVTIWIAVAIGLGMVVAIRSTVNPLTIS